MALPGARDIRAVACFIISYEVTAVGSVFQSVVLPGSLYIHVDLVYPC